MRLAQQNNYHKDAIMFDANHCYRVSIATAVASHRRYIASRVMVLIGRTMPTKVQGFVPDLRRLSRVSRTTFAHLSCVYIFGDSLQ